jgi:group I intron endonuclease
MKMKEIQGCIYLFTNLVNGKRYVGQHKNVSTVRGRWSGHLRTARLGDSRPLYRAINKHGWAKFLKEVIWVGVSDVDLLNKKETYYIKKHRSFIDDLLGDRSYNLTSGGEQYKRSKCSKIKMRISANIRWDDPIERARNKETQIRRWDDPIKHEESCALHNSPRVHKNHVMANLRRYEDPEECKKQSIAGLRRYAKPGEREKASNNAVCQWASKTSEERFAISEKIWKTRHSRWSVLDHEKAVVAAKRMWQSVPLEERSAYWHKTHPHGNKKKGSN